MRFIFCHLVFGLNRCNWTVQPGYNEYLIMAHFQALARRSHVDSDTFKLPMQLVVFLPEVAMVDMNKFQTAP